LVKKLLILLKECVGMKKILLILAVLLLSLVVFTACGEDDYEVLGDYVAEMEGGVENEVEEIIIPALDITFNETDSIIATTTGYTHTTQLGRRTYMFRCDDEVSNTNFVNTVEAIAQELEQFITISDVQFRINASSDDPWSYTFTNNELSMNFDNSVTAGWFTHAMSRGDLPIWLSAGLEVYIRGNIGLYAPATNSPASVAGFGDIMFIPEKWATVEMNTAIDIAYLFVNHLSENNLLENLIETYMGGDIATGNQVAERYFYSYFGEEMDMALRLEYFQANTSHVIIVTSDIGEHHFFFSHFDQNVPLSEIILLVTYMHDAAVFVIDFVYEFRSFEAAQLTFHLMYNRVDNRFAGGFDDRRDVISIFNMQTRPWDILMTIPHEISHAVMHFMVGYPLEDPFDEGFANFMSIAFNETDEAQSFPHLQMMIDDGFAPPVDNVREWANFLRSWSFHMGAYIRRIAEDYTLENVGFGTRYTNVNDPNHITDINTYWTATSFVIYLIDTYGIDKYMQVHWDTDNFANVYGRDIHGMIEEWRLFLYEDGDELLKFWAEAWNGE